MDAPEERVSFVGTAEDDRRALKTVLRVALFLAGVFGASYYFSYPTVAERAGTEARTYLASCTTTDCYAAADRFVASYQAAMQGDAVAEQHVFSAFYLGTTPVSRNLLQACAWGMVRLAVDAAHIDEGSVQDVQQLCTSLGSTVLTMANARSQQIIQAIRDAR